MILNSLKKELKKFTRFTTNPIKNLKASDLAKALKKLSEEINRNIDLDSHAEEVDIEKTIENFKKSVDDVFKTTVLKKYYKIGDNETTTWKRSGFVGFILYELYRYLTEYFLNYPVPNFVPEWLKISTKEKLKEAFKSTYNNEWNEKWIASVLSNEKVLESFIKVHNSIYNFEMPNFNGTSVFPPAKVSAIINEIFEELKKIGAEKDYTGIAKGFLNWAEKFGKEYPNICKYSNIKRLKEESRLEKFNKILDPEKIEQYKKDVEKYSIHIERLCSNLRMLFKGETQHRTKLFKYNDFSEVSINALNDILKKLQEKSPVRNKNIVEVSDNEFFSIVGQNDNKPWIHEDSTLEEHLWGKTGEPELEDLKQYGLGTCYLHAALMSLLQSDKGKKLIKKCFVSMDENYVTMQLYKIKKIEFYEKLGSDGTPKKGVTFIPKENSTLFKLKRTYNFYDNNNSTRAQWPHYFIKVFHEYKKLMPSILDSNEHMFDPLNTRTGKRFVEGGNSSWVFPAITGRKGRQNSSPVIYSSILKEYEKNGWTLSQNDTNLISKMDPVEYLKEKLKEGGNKSRALSCDFVDSTYRLSNGHAYTIVGIKNGGVCLLEPNKTRPLPLNFNELNEKGIEKFKAELNNSDNITNQNWKAKVEEFKNKYKYQKIEQPYFIFNKEHFKDGKDEFIVPFEEFKSNCDTIEKVNLSKKKGTQGKKASPKLPTRKPTTPRPPMPIPPVT